MLKDIDIRKKFICDFKEFLSSGIFVNEYCLGKKSRVDFWLFKDNLFYGFEIKSEADNLDRLPTQLKSYLRYFDFIYLIVSINHFESIQRLLKKFKLTRVGFILVDENNSFTIHSKPVLNNKISRLNSFLKNIDKKILEETCLRKDLKISENKNTLVDRLRGKLTFQEILPLFTRSLESYVSKCPNCKNSLTYNTTVSRKKQYTSKVIKIKVRKCFICDMEF